MSFAISIAEHPFLRFEKRISPAARDNSEKNRLSSPPASVGARQSEAKSYPFPVWSGLLTAKHKENMGNSIWSFLWFVDRVTNEREGLGVVLGGKPVKDREIATCFGIHENTVRNDRKTLIAGGYIDATRTPYGFRYRVRNSRKFGIWRKKRVTTSCECLSRDSQENVSPDQQNTVETKKTMQLDHAIEARTVPGFEAFWQSYPKKVGKLEADRAWRKVKPTEVELIFAGLESWKRSEQWKHDGGQYIPYPGTFLTKRRWEDAIPECGQISLAISCKIATARDIRPKGMGHG